MNEINILELFGGIGALTKAFKRLGIPHKVVDYVEIDKYAVASYNAINGTNFEPQDICEWNKDIKVDLIMHGSPCQSISLAGLQHGADEGSGTRSSLMWETVRIVEKLRPKYVIWENVKNLLSKKHRHNFDAYLEKMESLGYTNYYQVLNAKDYGIPQNRERVFTISILGSQIYDFPSKEDLDIKMRDMLEQDVDDKYYLSDKMVKYISATGTANFRNPDCKINLDVARPLTTDPNKRAGTTNYISDELPDNYDLQNFVFPEKQELKLKLKDMLEDEVDEKYYLSDKMVNFFYKNEQVQKEKGNGFRFGVSDGDVIAKTITTRAGARMDDNFVKAPHKALRETLEQNKIGNEEVQYIDSYNRKIKDDGLAKTITTRVNASNNDYLLIKEATKQGYKEAYEGDGVNIGSRMKYQRGNVQKDSIQTLTTSGGNERGVVLNDLRIRKLTPKECFRLMGFDDEDVDKAAKVNSNTQLYKQAGNSIVVNVLEAILVNLFHFDKWSDLD